MICSTNGASKTKSGSLRAIKNKAMKIKIWNRRMRDSNLNVYEDIDEYLHIKNYIELKDDKIDRLFLKANQKARNKF